jgi:hypothetical protein
MLTLDAPTSDTLEEMIRACLAFLGRGAVVITREDLQRKGFTAREIDVHGDAAIAEAREQWRNRHAARRAGRGP